MLNKVEGLVVFAFNRPTIGFGGTIELFAYSTQQGANWLAQPITFKESGDGDEPYEMTPFLSITREEGQQLMDSLWETGLRPTQGKGSAGQMEAVQAHLKDMRDLVFNLFGKGEITHVSTDDTRRRR